MNRVLFVASIVGITAAAPAMAQGRRVEMGDRGKAAGRPAIPQSGTALGGSPRRSNTAIPPGHLPPPGSCRVWIDGVPPGRQPRPTDCATAYRMVPLNGRVIHGSDRDGSTRADERRRVFTDANGMLCEERAGIDRDGRREYDLECRDPRDGRRAGREACIDRNRDGRCDEVWNADQRYPATLPDMIGAIIFGDGRRTDEVSRWLGTGRYQVRYSDRDRDRRPEAVSWVDAAGTLIQHWSDADGDGRADVVRFYRAGQLSRVIGR